MSSIPIEVKVTRDDYGAVKWYHCPYECGRTFETYRGLSIHVKRFCPNKPKPTETQTAL